MSGSPSRLASLAPRDDGRALNHAARTPTESSEVDGVALEVAELDLDAVVPSLAEAAKMVVKA